MPALMINTAQKKVVIIGGGSVAVRKAAYFSDAAVIMYSKTFEKTPAHVTCIQREVSPDDIFSIITGAFLVIAATSDPDLNSCIVAAARKSNILCNSANGEGDVIIPAQIEKGTITIGISTGGTAPVLAQHMRMQLETMLETMFPELEQMDSFLTALRSKLKTRIPDQKKRSEILHLALYDNDIRATLQETKESDLKNIMDEMAEEYIQKCTSQ